MSNISQINGLNITAESSSYAATASLLLGSVTSASYAATSSYSLTLGASLTNDADGKLSLINSNNTGISVVNFLTASLTVKISGSQAPGGDYRVALLDQTANNSPVYYDHNGITYNSSTDRLSVGQIAATGMTGSLLGTASIAYGVSSSIVTDTSDYRVAMFAANSYNLVRTSGVNITYNPDPGRLSVTHITATTITGSLLGTASYVNGNIFTNSNSATSASYAVTASYSLGPIRNLQNTTDGTIVTGSTSNTLTKSILIPANTVGVGDVIYIKSRARKTGTAGTLVVRMYVNTSAAIGGSLIATSATNAATNVYFQYTRTLAVKTTTNTETMAGNLNVNADDNVAVTTAVSANNIDWTQNQYLVIAHANSSISDGSVNSFGHIQINKA